MDQKIVTTARGIILDRGELLVFRLAKADNWYSLLGGKVEFGETLERAMEREIIEETNIKPELGKILLVHEMILPEAHRIEFFFFIKNGADYRHIDLSKSTHGFEITETLFLDPATTDKNILPTLLRNIVPEIISVGPENFEFRVLRGEPK